MPGLAMESHSSHLKAAFKNMTQSADTRLSSPNKDVNFFWKNSNFRRDLEKNM